MKILDIALKDLMRSVRNAFAIGMMLIVPLLIVGLIAVAFGGLTSGDSSSVDLPVTQVAVVNLDHSNSQNAGEMLAAFLKNDQFAKLMQVTELPDEASDRAAINERQTGVAVIIPADFTSGAFTGGNATLTLLHDPTLSVGPNIVKVLIGQFIDGFAGAQIALKVVSNQAASQGAALDEATQQAVIQQYVAWVQTNAQSSARGEQPVLDVQAPPSRAPQATTNPIGNMMGKTMAGMLIFFAFFTGAYAAQSIMREDEEGTLARLFTTPTSRATILAGKFTSVFITVVGQAVVLLIASSLIFRFDWGQPVSVALVVVGLVVVASGFGLFLMSFVKSARQAGPVTGGVLTVTGMMGGLFTVAVPNMPDAFNTLTQLMPQGWALRGWLAVLDGASLGELVLPFVVMLALGALLFALGVLRFRKRFA